MAIVTPGIYKIDTLPIQELLETVSLYLHIPFCHTRCYYCDFNTYAGILPLREPYVRALLTEIGLAGSMARREDGTPRRTRTIFFGGGTPSLLTVGQVTRLLDACRQVFAVDSDAEITLEANPGTLSAGQLVDLRAAGVNRLSMGAQSFDAELLKTLGRIHTPEEIVQALRNARAAGFTSINLDFMFGLPGQTMRHWRETLDSALSLHPEHLSLYSLIIEEGTPFYTWTHEGRITPGDEDLCADMYEYADERLQAEGYENYEISNWALPGHQSQHNLTYWRNLPYLGMGAGAHSFFARTDPTEGRGQAVAPTRDPSGGRGQAVAPTRRFSNVLDPQEYICLLKQGQRPEAESENIERASEMSETAFLGLRTAAGLHLPTFEQRFGEPFSQFAGERLRVVEEAGLLEREEDWLRLSKRGRLLGNEVFLRLLPD
ncbi:MAG TPA: radical SAM family heme chaperone HemW [Ktedonobacteraceae bacterium]|nr:radical SAM family heme chaperone HemW [Ktedonobacteraceae bacterium]